MDLDWTIIVRNWPVLLSGFINTLKLAVLAIGASFVLGVVAGALRLSRSPYLHYPAVLYIEIIRGVPLIMVIFWFYFLAPILAGRPLDNFTSALIAFIVFEAAYLAEIVRAGIQSVPLGQVQAAISTGLTHPQAMRHVILPQAIRNMIPALVTRFIVLFMDTSLAYIIGYRELTRVARIIAEREFRAFEVYTFIAIVYFVCTYAMSLVAQRLERRLGPA
ncbi:MAG: protein GltK1, glutamate/aspartate transport system permease protein [Candidatus Rokubacteria bacterium CSP1-6]|nr:MAG: protein GltK1, glutamate/aspartate transport system permease protein [Candidatus Rokubacteria bacterium CSP1-6]